MEMETFLNGLKKSISIWICVQASSSSRAFHVCCSRKQLSRCEVSFTEQSFLILKSKLKKSSKRVIPRKRTRLSCLRCCTCRVAGEIMWRGKTFYGRRKTEIILHFQFVFFFYFCSLPLMFENKKGCASEHHAVLPLFASNRFSTDSVRNEKGEQKSSSRLFP